MGLPPKCDVMPGEDGSQQRSGQHALGGREGASTQKESKFSEWPVWQAQPIRLNFIFHVFL